MASLAQLRVEVEQELTGNILPFHIEHALDEQNGGFYGRIDSDNRIHPEAPKGLVQHSRLLWTYARAYRQFEAATYLEMAERAFSYLLDHFWDKKAGGLYWLVDFGGQPLVSDKYVYGQSFGIYGLAEYYLASGDERSLEMALALFQLLEDRARDDTYGGYFEVFEQDWGRRLAKNVDSEDGPVDKTMNSHLHLLEAYTSLMQAWPGDQLRNSLRHLAGHHLEQIIDPATGHLLLHFTADWKPLNKHISYGHDIEASWLLVEAAGALGEAGLLAETQAAAQRMAAIVYAQGMDGDGGLLSEPGRAFKEWWPQAEALVGFLNAYQLSGQAQYLEAVHTIWAYVQRAFVDQTGGEWFAGRQADGGLADEEKAGVWKTPYHNGRACLELMSRIDALDTPFSIEPSVSK